MLNRRYTIALEGLAHATKRLAVAEEKLNELRIEQLRRERGLPPQPRPEQPVGVTTQKPQRK